MKRITPYQLAVFLSFLSFAFGILREFLVIGMLGFSSINDRLQLYLSIFYTIGLSIDAMRLSCLNLYSLLSLPRLLLIASLIGLPFSIIIALILNHAIDVLDPTLLAVCILGSYLNLIAALLITYLQRQNIFLLAQLINILPNFILIPGILGCYWFLNNQLLPAIVCLTTLIPVLQCALLLFLTRRNPILIQNQASFFSSVLTFLRHFSVILGEQLFQIVLRAAFYVKGVGFLTVYTLAIRIYSAFRFILIDSFIGSKLALWKDEIKLFHSPKFSLLAAMVTLLISFRPNSNLLLTSIQMIIIFLFGFYLATFVRLLYFKINRNQNNPLLIVQFALYELLGAFCAFLLTKQFNAPILALLWIGYIAKPSIQLLLLRTPSHEIY